MEVADSILSKLGDKLTIVSIMGKLTGDEGLLGCVAHLMSGIRTRKRSIGNKTRRPEPSNPREGN